MPLEKITPTATKVSDTEISVSKQPPTPEAVVTNYNYDFLVQQKASIIKQANDFLAARQVELDEVQSLLDQCASLGISAQVMPAPLGTLEQPIG